MELWNSGFKSIFYSSLKHLKPINPLDGCLEPMFQFARISLPAFFKSPTDQREARTPCNKNIRLFIISSTLLRIKSISSNAACFKNIFDEKIWSISIQQKMKGQESLYDHVSLS